MSLDPFNSSVLAISNPSYVVSDLWLSHLTGLRCVERELEFANNCADLLALFPCEAGCGHQVGSELPAYAHQASLDTHRQCLVSDIAFSKCEAKFAKTTRLCFCLF